MRAALRGALRGALWLMAAGIAGTVTAGASPPDNTAAARAATREQLADGLSYHHYEARKAPPNDEVFLSLGVVRNTRERQHVTACAAALGVALRFAAFEWSGDSDARYDEALAGPYSTQDEATAFLAAQRVPPGCIAWPTKPALFPQLDQWPSLVHVFELAPSEFRGRLQVVHGKDQVAGRTATSQIARDTGAIAAINGGFFVGRDSDGVAGEPTSVSITNGRLQSEPISQRPWFAITNEGVTKAELQQSTIMVTPTLKWSDGTAMRMDGINRKPELKRDCGHIEGAAPLAVWHDYTCLLQDQLVAINANAGFVPPYFQNALYALIGADGAVTKTLAEPTGDELLLVATGSRIAELELHIAAGHKAALLVPWLDENPRSFAISGAPTLLRGGAKIHAENTEGWPFAEASWEQANRMHRWVNIKNPRTAMGVRGDGTVLLVVVDGRRFSASRKDWGSRDGGATIEEMRELMLALGAVDAMNLDGGGSSTAVIKGQVVNTPSDDAGERPVGDALIVLAEAG